MLIQLPFLSSAAKALITKLGPKLVKAIGIGKKVARSPVVRTAAGTAVTVGAVKATSRPRVAREGELEEPPPPQLPAEYQGTPGTYARSPGGTVIGQVPGVPLSVSVPPILTQCLKAPKGYVLVDSGQGQKVAVLAKVAYALGLRKRPVKSTRISSRDISGARKVQSFITRFSVGRTPRLKLKRGRRK